MPGNPAINTEHNWTHYWRGRSYGSTAFRAGGLGSKHSTPELRPLRGRIIAKFEARRRLVFSDRFGRAHWRQQGSGCAGEFASVEDPPVAVIRAPCRRRQRPGLLSKPCRPPGAVGTNLGSGPSAVARCSLLSPGCSFPASPWLPPE